MEGLENNTIDTSTQNDSKSVGLGGNSVCDVCVVNDSSVTLEDVTAKYWQTNSITGAIEGSKLTIVDGVQLSRDEQTNPVKDLEYDTTPNPRYDHWSMHFKFAGESYNYKDKRCNISKEDAHKLVKLRITGSPKNGFTFHVTMPKSSSCKGGMD